MSAPHALIEFFQKEAMEYLGRLDQMMADADAQTPDAATFLTNARALRGSATMTRLEGLPDLASTIERLKGYLKLADFGTCAPDWPLMDEWDRELAEGLFPTGKQPVTTG